MWRLLPPLALLAALGCGAQEPAPQAQPSSARSAAELPPPASASAPPSAHPPSAPAEPEYQGATTVDVWIRGGSVLDGTGGPARAADVVIAGERVVHVGRVSRPLEAAREIDATGKLVTPGFIDAHSHADPVAGAEALLAQGVTTIVVGQDGRSAEDIAAFLRETEQKRPRVNVATLYGHATARTASGAGRGPASARARDELRRRIGQAHEAGAFGLSLGLEYEPGLHADESELAAAARATEAGGGLVMAHLRSEDDDDIVKSIDELLALGSHAKRLHVAHLKIVLGRGEARAEALLERLSEGRKRGLEVSADLYPYTASYTTLGILFPEGAKTDEGAARMKQRDAAGLLRHLRERVNARNGPEATLLGTGDQAGKTLAELAAQRGVPFEQILYELGPRGGSAAYFVMDEAVMRAFLVGDGVMIGTDGGGGGLHPRGHGSFARVLARYVRDERVLTLPLAVHKMSGLPARTLRMAERGVLAPGKVADVAVFDLARVEERASFQRPHVPAKGMSHVLVAGRVAYEDGKLGAARAGRVLRRAPPR